MSTAVAPYRVSKTPVAMRVRRWVDSAISRLRSVSTTGANGGWSLVRGQQPSDFQQSGGEVRRLGWERHPVVNACARVVVEMIQSVPLEVYRKRADGTANVLHGNNEALALLAAPRQGLNGARLIGRTATHFFLYGNAFWVIERNGKRGRPRGIRVIPPEDIQFVWLGTDDAISAYDWRDLQGRTHEREPIENVMHFRDIDATDGLFGYPRLAAALLDIGADSEASAYVRQIVGNHGVPGMVVSVDGAPLITELEAGEARFREKYTKRGMRGMTAFMAGIKELTPIGFDLQQLEFPDLRKVSRESICAAAAVDPRMIGVGSASTDGGLSGVQFREARHRLIQQTVYPIMRAIEDELNYWFMPEFGEQSVRFSEEYIAAMTEDVTATSARIVAELAAKMRTVEESREAVGLPAEMDPTHRLSGDGVTVQEAQENAVALGAAKITSASEPTTPPSGVSAPDPSQPPMAPGIDNRALLAGTPKRAWGRVVDYGPALMRGALPTTDDLERAFERAALLLFASERKDVARILASFGLAGDTMTEQQAMSVLRAIAVKYAPNGKVADAWTARFEELIARAVIDGGRDIAATVGLSFSRQNPRVLGIVARRAADLVTNVTETTREAIRAAVVAGMQQGLGIAKIAKLIADTTFGEITRSRATTIARTEVIGARNSGNYAAAVQSGVMRSKTWIANLDERTRESHASLNGVTVDIGSAFANGLRYPHDPLGSAAECVNCRCSLTFSDLEARVRT